MPQLVPTFVPLSSFTPPLSRRTASSFPCARSATTQLRMVTPKHVRRTEEIKRLTKQLEELRATRDRLKDKSSSPNPETPKPTSRAPSSPPRSSTTAPPSTSLSARAPVIPPNPPNLPFGRHSMGSRFLTVSSIESDEGNPIILSVAGHIPGLTTTELLDTPSMLYNKSPARGNLFLARSPDGYNGNIVALTSIDALLEARDPVAVLVHPQVLSAVDLPIAPDDDILVVIDRAVDAAADEPPFDSKSFYAWDVDGKVFIGWLDNEPSADQATRIGRVLYGIMETDPDLRAKKSCWEEENEAYT